MNNKRVFIIEDDRSVALGLRLTLIGMGFDATCFESGNEALIKLANEEPDIIITDYDLPDINGIELIDKLKAENKDIPLIMITGYTDKALLEKLVMRKEFNLIGKPFDSKELQENIENALEIQISNN
jgi:two-component system C4-dicarboxylate transport response regulator DctD